MWGLHEYVRATSDRSADPTVRAAAQRAGELFLSHELFRSTRTGAVINKEWLGLRYPAYWHYNVLQALIILGRMGKLTDSRTAAGLDLIERRRLRDGRWRPGGYWWAGVGGTRAPEVVDWGRGGPNEMITLNALRVLHAADRLD